MKKYDYQTCLRLPTFLKDEMTTICDTYRINESDLMRRAISEFVQTHTHYWDHELLAVTSLSNSPHTSSYR